MTDNANPPTDSVIAADEQPPPSIEEMKAAIKANHGRLVRRLGEKRAEREKLNAEIRGLVEQLTEAERLVKALEPRKAKK